MKSIVYYTLIAFICIVCYTQLVSAPVHMSTYNPWTQRLQYLQSPNQTGFNWTADYFKGQPMIGSLDSGIIWAEELDSNANLNLTHIEGTLDITYKSVVVMLVDTMNNVKYCTIPGDTVTTTDNQHSVYYVSTDCSVQSTTIDNYITTDLSPGGITELFNSMAHSGAVEVHQGAPIQNKINIKNRKATFSVAHLRVISGMSLSEELWKNFTISSGEYIYINDVVTPTTQNLTNNATLEIFYHSGGDWNYDEYVGTTQTGLNLTSCDDGSGPVTCSVPSKYRRYFLFMTGFSDGDDETKIHQSLASEDITYVSIGDCLNTEANPLTYLVPDIYTYTIVPLYAYCGRASDTAWGGTFIDLRTATATTTSGGIDTSIFLTKDGTRPLTANWNAGNFNISASFRWNNLTDYPVSCPLGTHIEKLGDSITCTAPNALNLTNFGTALHLNRTGGNVTEFTNISADFYFGDGRYLINLPFTGNSTAEIVTIINAYPTGNTTAEINAVESDPKFDEKILANRTGNVAFEQDILATDIVSTGYYYGDGRFITGIPPTGNTTAEIVTVINAYPTGNTSAELTTWLNSNRTGGDVSFSNDVKVTQGLNLSAYPSCTALETDASGNVLCGSDDGGSGMDYTNLAMINKSNTFGAYNQTFDTSTLHVDSGSDRVGIGTSSPNTKLHILGPGYEQLRIESTAGVNNAGGIVMKNAGGQEFWIQSSSANPTDGWFVYDATNAKHRFVILNNGNIGIGTTTPQQKLNVVGNINVTGAGTFGNAYVGNHSYGTTYATFGYDGVTQLAGQYAFMQKSDGTTFMNSAPGKPVNFRINNLGGMTLTSTGLGIGTATPSASLVVSNAGAEGIEMYKNIGSNTVQIQAYNRGASSYSHMAYNAGSHIFKIGGVEKARIHTNNYFGIGTTTPTHTFNNYGTTNLSGDTIIEGDLSHLKAVWKQDSTTIQSDITSTEDTQLNLTIPSAGLWTFENTIFVTTTTTADFRFGYTLPVSSNGLMHYVAYSGAVSIAEGYTTETGDALSTVLINYATAPAIDAIVVDGWFQATAPGRIALIWAQGTSQAADTTVWARSYMKAVRGD